MTKFIKTVSLFRAVIFIPLLFLYCIFDNNPTEQNNQYKTNTNSIGDTVAVLGDTLTLWVNTSKPDIIYKYLWDINGDEIWDDTTTNNLLPHVWTVAGSSNVIVSARDKSGEYTEDFSFKVYALSDEYIFSLTSLYLYYIFQDSLPKKYPYSYLQPEKLYKSLNEPYTKYFNSTEAKSFMSMLKNENSAGIGIMLDSTVTGLCIKEVFHDSPGEKAGLVKGDTITFINQVPIKDNSFTNAVKLLKGNTGDICSLTVKRDTISLNINVTLGSFIVPSVFTDSLSSSIAYILITGFFDSTTTNGGGTSDEFVQALKKTSWAPYTILDLRRDGGGLLSQCTKVASEFVTAPTKIVKSRQRVVMHNNNTDQFFATTKDSIFMTTSNGTAANRNFIVLTDNYTASASEIIVTFLREQKNFKIVGMRTYGKARGQVIFPTPKDALLKITYATLAPISGQNYDLIGIEPDYITQTSEEALDKGIDVINNLIGKSAKVTSRINIISKIRKLRKQIRTQKTPMCIEIRKPYINNRRTKQ